MTKAVEVKGLSVNYQDIRALCNINLSIEQKAFLAIIGPNGGGKSTLLKAIMGLVSPTRGTIEVFGTSCWRGKSRIGYVPQNSRFDRGFPVNVMDVVLMGRLSYHARPFKAYSWRDKEVAVQKLNQLDIYSLRHRHISQLSGGQLQRLLLARALAVEPQLLLLDEPTIGVDIESRTRLYEILQEINKEVTIVLVTHDVSAISTYVKEIACLNGSLYYHGEPQLKEVIRDKLYGCPVELILNDNTPHGKWLKREEGF